MADRITRPYPPPEKPPAYAPVPPDQACKVGDAVAFYNLTRPDEPGPIEATVMQAWADGSVDLMVLRRSGPHLEERVGHQNRADAGRYWRRTADGKN